VTEANFSLRGKVVVVTGGNGGLGRAMARAVRAAGATVVVTGRNPDRNADAARDFDVRTLDVRDPDAVEALFADVRADLGRLDVLVNNAGVALRARQVTADGHEQTWETNFLGGFLLTRLLLPALKVAPRPRVVNVSSEAHRTGRIDWSNLELEKGYGGFQAYSNSKLAQVLFTRELARREPRVGVNAVHPGTIATSIWRELPAWLRWLPRLLFPSAAKGAAPVIRLALAPELDGVSGCYFKKLREVSPSYAGRNDADAARLWEVAAKATGAP
jgi:retinol dehydrogenase-12